MAGTDREAAVRLTLGVDDYLTNIRKVGSETEKVERTMVKAGKASTLAFGGAKKSLGDLASSTSNLIGMAGGLAGAFSLGSAVRSAIGLREQFKDLAFQVSDATKGQVTWQQLMKDAEAATSLTGKTTAELGRVMKQSFEDVGELDYARATMVAVGQVSKATGKDMAQLATVAGTLAEKFNATAETLPDMLAAVVSKLDQGGLSLEAMGPKFALLAGEAADAGFTGAKGVTSLVGALNALDDRLAEKSIPAFKALFQTIKDGSSGLKELEKQSGLKLEGDTGVEKIRKLITSEKGRKALEVKLGGDMRVIADQLAVPFDEAFQDAKKAGLSAEESTKKGVAAFDEFLREMADAGKTGADYAKEAAQRAADDPRVKLEAAMDKVAQAFLRPKLIGAVDKIADKLPAVADALGKALEFVADHPLLAAGAGVGAVAAKGAAGSVLKDMVGPALGGLVKEVLWKAAVKSSTGGGKGGPEMPDWLESTALGDMGGFLGDGAVDTIEKKGGKAGKKIGDAATEALGESGGLTRVGKALAIVAAAQLAYEIGKMAIDDAVEDSAAGMNTVALANAATAEGVPEAQKKKALDEVTQELARLQQEMGGGGTMVADEEAGGERMVDALGRPIGGPSAMRMAGMAATGLGNVLGLVSDEDATVAANALPNEIARAKARKEELEKQLAAKPPAVEEGFGIRATPEKMPSAKDMGESVALRLRNETLKVRVINIEYASHGTLEPRDPSDKWFDLSSFRRKGRR